MPYCPRCGHEFRRGESCPDCGTALIADRAPESAPAHEQVSLVKVAEAANETLAAIWAGLLENDGIPCLIKATGVSIGGWGYATMLPHHIFVRSSDEARAIALLHDYGKDAASVSIKPARRSRRKRPGL